MLSRLSEFWELAEVGGGREVYTRLLLTVEVEVEVEWSVEVECTPAH